MGGFLLLVVLLCIISAVTAVDNNNNDNDVVLPTVPLSSGAEFPLVGLGVGNLQHNLIEDRIEKAMATDKRTMVFDTAHASRNEDIVRRGVGHGLIQLQSSSEEVHVVTKVWYTHLGYDRTIMSVRESLRNLNHAHVKVHILLHWPRCRDDIPWMNCEQEEQDLPLAVKNAGPPPHLHKETAFLESWTALEDIYLGNTKLGKGLPKLESIGVSNFALDDLKEMGKTQRVTPHILQGNIWSYVFDPNLIDYCRENQILFQAFNVINGVFYDRDYEDAPNAILALNAISQQLSQRAEPPLTPEDHKNYTLPQVVLKWLVQNDVSVIPRTSKIERLQENSAVSIARMPPLDPLEEDTVQSAVAALLTKEDIKPPLAEFINRSSDTLVNIFWVHGETGEEVSVKEGLPPGETYTAFTQRDHTFAVYFQGTNQRKEFVVHAQHGQHQRFDLNPLEDEEL
ncbi:Probable NAD(P)H-dependent D-xylose reductase xyl1 [Seminavis robusta]|uniref:Probable NAD(P)H-dependent D-xylose reductase xyl1 n=1 Tax=Seminavis robusta TaxID=568900 RepID=A0A9N8HID3_9STRA|nr:Probable NAD(P)H-dependent D-xylose reductase xyl1 [Seminavis robusta]|eukprot:Sro618_g176180.1 Probable NAD(P)H-dependent D-xylose reductase xyl1 (454) ;mRNA; f:6858-8352